MRVLYLTSNLGYGHTRAADAVDAALRQEVSDLESERLDLWSLMDRQVAASVKDGYLRMTREQPDLYQKLYDLDVGFWRQLSGEERPDPTFVDFLTEQQRRWFPRELNWLPGPGRDLDQALLNSFIRLTRANYTNPSRKIVLRSLLLLMRIVLLNRMKERIQRFAPDLIVATQMYPAALLAHLKLRGNFLHIPSVGIVTDYGLQSIWIRPPTDMYCVGCSEVVGQLVQQGVAEQRVHFTGIPLLPQFRSPPDRVAARRTLDIEPDRDCVFVIGGQYGIGMVEAVFELVSTDRGLLILVATGRSGAAPDRLQALAQRHPDRIRIFGRVEDMSVLYSAADVVVGKPGGLSVSEALACGRPFFATCSLGGQERHNIVHLERNGVGGAIEVGALPARLANLFSEPGRIRDLQQRAFSCGHHDGAEKIAGLIHTVSEKRDGRSKAGTAGGIQTLD